jgi:hypothetical protein
MIYRSGVHTTASCSFSSCRCKSAAVKGLGCLSGPGPAPTPVLSPVIPIAVLCMTTLAPGATIGCTCGLTVLWFEGRIFSVGEERGRVGGAICCDCLLDVGLEDAPKGRGEGGTVLRSGIVLLSIWRFEVSCQILSCGVMKPMIVFPKVVILLGEDLGDNERQIPRTVVEMKVSIARLVFKHQHLED